MGVVKESVYTDPDMITALYNNPEDQELLVRYSIETGGIQLGIVQVGAIGDTSVLREELRVTPLRDNTAGRTRGDGNTTVT